MIVLAYLFITNRALLVARLGRFLRSFVLFHHLTRALARTA